MCIDGFLRSLQSLGVKKDDISGEPLKIKYNNVAPYSTTSVTKHQLRIKMRRKIIMRKKYDRQVISIEFIKTIKHYPQDCHREGRAMFTSHPGSSLTFSMFINL